MLPPLGFARWFVLPAGLFLAWIATASLESAPMVAEPATPAEYSPQPAAGMRLVPASDPSFRYEGRFDQSAPSAPVVIWQGSRISIDFTGSQLTLLFDGLSGESYFDVHVDGAQAILAVPVGVNQRLSCPLPLTGGLHHLMLFKRSEATAGVARFRGIEIAQTASIAASPAPNYRMAMEFIGDSITVGACDEDGTADQWTDRRTHNNALSYGALTAAAFDADYRNIAVSGMGVVIGWYPDIAADMWNRVYADPKSPKADLGTWTPDVVFINLGENDDSFTRAKKMPFPVTFSEKYVTLIRSIRSAYPAATIVVLRGGMYGGAKSVVLRKAWKSAVAELERTDPHVTHFVFHHWTKTHPRVIDHRAMADELISWLKLQPFMKALQPARQSAMTRG